MEIAFGGECGARYVVGPSGNLIMGSPSSETGRKTDEGPETEVVLSKGFWLGKTEVTVGQWKAVTGYSLREQVIRMLHDDSVYDFGDRRALLARFHAFRSQRAG